MDLVLIGRFETASDAEAAVERMEALRDLAETKWSQDEWRHRDERMPGAMVDELRRLELYDLGRRDVDQYAFDHTVKHNDGTIVRIETEESEVQGFLKVLLHLGARVEVFSLHNWNEDGTPQKTVGS